MKGFEPTTFCMASVGSVRSSSRPFAESVLEQGDSLAATEHERTRANRECDHCDHAHTLNTKGHWRLRRLPLKRSTTRRAEAYRLNGRHDSGQNAAHSFVLP
jgi:hypothetical protein